MSCGSTTWRAWTTADALRLKGGDRSGSPLAIQSPELDQGEVAFRSFAEIAITALLRQAFLTGSEIKIECESSCEKGLDSGPYSRV